MTPHNPQFANDEIMIMRSAGKIIACGYKCSRCGKPVFPLGALLPDSLLTDKELKILNDLDCRDDPKA